MKLPGNINHIPIGMNKTPHKDHRYVEALLNNDDRVLSEIYQRYSGKVVAFISKNSGSSDDAKDVIQEVLITIFHQAKEKGFILTCPFDAYFFLLCKRKWLNKLNEKSLGKEVTILDEVVSVTEEQEQLADETDLFEQRTSLFEAKFLELGKKCQDLLKKAFQIKSMEKVAEALGVSYGYARKKKSQCIGKLTQLIKGAGQYHQLQNV